MKIQTIFEAFERHQLGEEDPSQLLAEIVTKLPKVRLPCLLCMWVMVMLPGGGWSVCPAAQH